VRRALSVNSATASNAGVNPWWAFDGGSVPGVGQYAVNVAQGGDLTIEAQDMAIPHKGVPLTFQRVYNSLSQHDYFGTDGSQISNYGAGWTNNFDAHLASNSGNQYGAGLSVFDVDGTRYDYMPDGSGNWIPPAGQYATLTCDGSPPSSCGNGYFWIQKDGTAFYFWKPDLGGSYAGLQGRLVAIWGRNNNARLTFNFAFTSGDASCSCNLSDLYVSEEDGRTAHLSFADVTVNGQSQRLLSTLAWPDGTTIAYGYDANGNLAEVDEPPSNTYSTSCQNGVASCVPQWYFYNAPSYAPGYTLMSWVYSPRLVVYNEGYTEPAGPSGTGITFGYDLSHGNALVGVADYGYVNPTPPDGTGTAIQPSVSNAFNQYRYIGFSRDYSSTTNVWDSDGHSRTYAYDGSGRVTEFTAATGSTPLSSYLGWDTQNNRISSTDPRGNETDYAFDANGNLIASALPSLTTSDGTFRPTNLYSYSNNNLVAACSPRFAHHHSPSLDWTSRPPASDSLCPAQLGSESSEGSTVLTWSSPTTADPSGELLSMTNAAGYTVSYTYTPAQEGGSVDYGLPTTISGTSFLQYDNTNVQPAVTVSYDAYGDIVSSNQGLGASTGTYDQDGRPLTMTDADGAESHIAYYANGLPKLTQTPAQYAASTGVGLQYDADGDLTSEAHNFTCTPGNGCTQGVTSRWYDGADRLVEVSLPNDSTDYYPFPWLTRYIYDLSQGQQVAIGGSQYGSANVRAYGNLYKQQTCATSAIQSYNNPGSSCQWFDQKGSAFDGIDRSVAQYFYQPGGNLQAATTTFDGSSATLGLATQSLNAIGDLTTYAYDNAGRPSSISFTSGTSYTYPSEQTPGRSYVYDANGRVQSILTGAFGNEVFAYTPDGNVQSVTEPTGGSGVEYYQSPAEYFGGNLSSPAVLSYSYYANGSRAGVSITSNGLTQNNIKQYAYRADGLLEKRSYNAQGQSVWQVPTFTNAGRPTGSSDMFNSSAESLSYDQYGQLTSLNIPAAQYSSIQHDLEGKILSYNINPPLYGPSGGPTTLTNTYNIRGEVLSQDCQYPQNCASAHGFLYPPDNTDFCVQYGPHGGWDTACGTEYTKFDARNGANLGTYVNFTSFTGPNNQYIRPSGSTYSTPVNFDLAGRELGETGTLASQYDVENHQVMTPPGVRYAFGPDGNLVYSWYGSNSLTHHWDGSALLMTTDNNGTAQDVLFDKTANMTPRTSYTGITFFDRDFSGATASAHNATGYSGVGYPISDAPGCGVPQYVQSTFTMGGACSATSGSTTIQPLPYFWRTDGYFDGYTVIQGARSYDGNARQWTSMDQYGGDTMNPMSEQPYIWNGNDPISFFDPTGYDICWSTDVRGPDGNIIGGRNLIQCPQDPFNWYGPSQIGNLGPGAVNMISVTPRLPDVVTIHYPNGMTTTLDRCLQVYPGIEAGLISSGITFGWVQLSNGLEPGRPAVNGAEIAKVVSQGSVSAGAGAFMSATFGGNLNGTVTTVGIGPPGFSLDGSYNFGPTGGNKKCVGK
jgi:YD repeat-containing protein